LALRGSSAACTRGSGSSKATTRSAIVTDGQNRYATACGDEDCAAVTAVATITSIATGTTRERESDAYSAAGIAGSTISSKAPVYDHSSSCIVSVSAFAGCESHLTSGSSVAPGGSIAAVAAWYAAAGESALGASAALPAKGIGYCAI
jgi:hypothetical protein